MTTVFPPGNRGVAYSYRTGYYGGRPPFTWDLAAGALPVGLALGAQGQVTGTPDNATPFGVPYNFTPRLTDVLGRQASKAFDLSCTYDIWTADNNAGAATRATRLSAYNGAQLATPALGGAFEITFDGTYVWVVSPDSAKVYKIDAWSGLVLTNWNVAILPAGVCSDLAGNIYVAAASGAGNGWLKQYSNAGVAGFVANVGDGPYSPSFGDGHVWVPNYNSSDVTKVRVSDGSVIGTYGTGGNPFRSCFANGHVWVPNRVGNTVRKFNATDGATIGTYATGNEPVGICYDGTHIYVANKTDGTVTKRLEADGSLAGTYAACANAYGICTDGADLWVTSTSLNKVYRIRCSDGTAIANYAVGTGPTAVCTTLRTLPWT